MEREKTTATIARDDLAELRATTEKTFAAQLAEFQSWGKVSKDAAALMLEAFRDGQRALVLALVQTSTLAIEDDSTRATDPAPRERTVEEIRAYLLAGGTTLTPDELARFRAAEEVAS